MANKEISIKSLVSTPLHCFSYVGLNPKTDSTWIASALFYYLTVNQLIIIIMSSLDGIGREMNIDDMCEKVMILPFTIEMLVKCVHLYISKSKFNEVLQLLERFYDVNDPNTPIGRHQKVLNILHKFVTSYKLVIRFDACVYLAGSLIAKDLMILVWLPDKDILQSNFLALFLLNTWQSSTFLLTIIVFEVPYDTLFAILIWCAILQLKILRDFLENFDKLECNEEQKRMKLKTYIEHQNLCYRYIEGIEELFRYGALTLLFAAVSGTCFSVYLFTVSVNLKFLFFTMATCLQMLGFCLTGQELTSESELLARSAYYSGWENCDKTSKNMLQMIMMRSQRSAKLTAGKFFDLGLDVAVKVVRMAVSIFTLMVQTNNKKLV